MGKLIRAVYQANLNRVWYAWEIREAHYNDYGEFMGVAVEHVSLADVRAGGLLDRLLSRFAK